MIKSSRLVALFSFGLIAFGGMTALKSNDLNTVKIFTYQMKPIFSPGDRQSVVKAAAKKRIVVQKDNKVIADKIIASIKKDSAPAANVALPKSTKTSYVTKVPKGDILLNEKQKFSSLRTYGLANKQPKSLTSSYRVASSSPINIIPDYSLPKKFVRSYERLVMGKEITTTAKRNALSYRGSVRKNGPVMLRPIVSRKEAIRQISTARLPVSSAKAIRASQTAMR